MTSPTQSRLSTVCALLNAAGARYVVVGASAMHLWGTTRATRDIDVLIEPTPDNAERVLDGLGQLPFQVARDVTARDVLSRAVTMIGDTPNVDILTRAWNLHWEQAARDVCVFEIDGVPVPTVSLSNLIISKSTGRPQDDADIVVLRALLEQQPRP